MGQAKSRGSRDERQQQAIERVRAGLQVPKIEALREAHDIPESAAFIGYVVRFVEDDSFLQAITTNALGVKSTMVREPGNAKRYADVVEAAAVAGEYGRPAEACAMFESDTQFLVIAVVGNEHCA